MYHNNEVDSSYQQQKFSLIQFSCIHKALIHNKSNLEALYKASVHPFHSYIVQIEFTLKTDKLSQNFRQLKEDINL